MHDVAQAAGVSIKTVSNVVRGQGSFSDATRARVDAAIEELGYRPNLAARGLRSGRLGVISLIVPDIRNPYFAELADAVMTAAAAHDLLVLLEQSRGDRDVELELLRGNRTQMVDGILFSVLGLVDGGPELPEGIPNPVVVLGEPVPGWATDHVTMRNAEGAQAAVRHLLDDGRTRIAALGALHGRRTGTAALRLAGYRQALADAGIGYDPALVVDVGVWSRSAGAEGTRRLVRAGDFDGLLAFNDAMALGAMRVLEDSGRKVPADVAVVGFDDIDETRYSVPALSTVKPALEDIAATAVAYLIDRIGRADAGPPRAHRAGVELLVRESSSALSRR
ncbi:substrate-binding domain-containing protein [Kineococcus sp. R8]|nr:LacI family DNA-binding transcriptional regulator [Kineococcus siccus]NAZ80779.1 substrate-binding domain-containing protein [Kineococcus siccus]